MATDRADLLKDWLLEQINYTHIDPIVGDASTRRYYRVRTKNDCYIAVDAPPATEQNQAFVSIAKDLSSKGLKVPHVHAANLTAGFLLLSDLGDKQLFQIINQENVDYYYTKALHDLIALQSPVAIDWQLPLFSEQLLSEELQRFNEWYLTRHLGLELDQNEMTMLQKIYQALIAAALEQPQVYVHRDYHSRNLMVLPSDEFGILDFQDAVIGPITYDLVSLLRDCYLTWPSEQVYSWVERFWNLLVKQQILSPDSLAIFIKWFDWIGLQRHLKVLGIFARLYRRDNKSIYLKDIPRVLDYVLFVCNRYPDFAPLKNFIIQRVLPHESDDIGSGARQAPTTTDRHNA